MAPLPSCDVERTRGNPADGGDGPSMPGWKASALHDDRGASIEADGGLDAGAGSGPEGGVLPPGPALAFPGAVGFGRNATGGRDGAKLYIVSNTKTSGAGSLPWALGQPGPRIVVFKTGGLLEIGKMAVPANTTLLFQTAPGDGFAIRGALDVAGSNVIIRGLRLFGEADSDGTAVGLAMGNNLRNIIIDHSSIAWIRNESMSTWTGGPMSELITVQYTAIYEGLARGPGHEACNYLGPKACQAWEAHAMQLCPASRMSLYRNALINTDGRAPKFAGPVNRAELVNSISMQASTGSGKIDSANSANPTTTGQVLIHAIKNKVKQDLLFNILVRGSTTYGSGSQLYLEDNRTTKRTSAGQSESSVVKYKTDAAKSLKLSSTPAFKSEIPASAIEGDISKMEQIVLDEVGPHPRDRYLDAAIKDYKSGTRHFQCPQGLPKLTFAAGTYPKDSDDDGLPDAWEQKNGLDPNEKGDALIRSESGYLWIETYANSLIP
jgi:hypothetical protein